jgi:hypothetical protein
MRGALCAALLAGACAPPRSGDPALASGSASAGTQATDSDHGSDAGGPGDGAGTDADPTAPGSDSADPIFDVGNGDTDGPPIVRGCDKVDLLFVIDNSHSMVDEQDNLIAAVPGFVAAIESLEDVESFHVGIVSTDAYARQPEACRALGALITQTGGENSSSAVCGPWSSGRFMTEEDDFTDGFRCAARIGTAGDGDERPIEAVLTAVSPEMGAPGACNEGFVRDDALLVVVLITDEEDDHEMLGPFDIAGSPGDPPQWFQALVERKGGVPDNVAVLSLLGHPKPNACPEFQWDGFDGAEIAPRLIAFTEMFPAGAYGDVCAPNYDEFFTDAVAEVATACTDFVPPG